MFPFDLFRKDPTYNWPERAPVQLSFDLARGQMNGVTLGAHYEQLRAFGRPSNRKPLRAGHLGYAPLGLEIGVRSEHVDGFTCHFQGGEAFTGIDTSPEFSPCHLELRLPSGSRVHVSGQTSQAELEAWMGPIAQSVEAGYPVQYILTPGAYVGVELDEQDRVRILDFEPLPDRAA